MTETAAPIAAPVTPDSTGGDFVVPTHNLEGRELTAQEQFAELMRNPDFVRDALVPHTKANALKIRLDAAMVNSPPAKAASETRLEEYRLPYPPGLEGLSPEQQEFDQRARGWLQAANLSADEGSQLATLLAHRLDHWAEQPPEAHETAADEAEAQLRGILGAKFDDYLKDANALISEIELTRPGLKAWLANTGLANDPQVVTALAHLRQRQRL